jgi:hypothetical protein
MFGIREIVASVTTAARSSLQNQPKCIESEEMGDRTALLGVRLILSII